jgi:hypothetical protein
MCSKQRNAGKSRLSESTPVNRIHKHSLGRLGADTLTFCESTHFVSISRIFCMHSLVQKSRVYPPLFRSNYFHKESTLFEKFEETSLFFMNTTLHPWNESTLWKDSQKDWLCSYYADFPPNYFEYRLCFAQELAPSESINRCRGVMHDFVLLCW